MENFWVWFVEDISAPGTLIVLGFFGFLAVAALLARLRKRKSGESFFLWEIVSAVASWFK